MPTGLDLSKAFAYIAELNHSPLQLPIGPQELHGERIQPTIGPDAARLLDVLIFLHRPKTILEIGGSYGYSACTMGRAAAVYGGHVTSLEINPVLADAAKKNSEFLRLNDTVEILCGEAKALLNSLPGPFDLIVQDGHKLDYVPLLEPLCARLSSHGMMVTDDILFPVMALPPSVNLWQNAVADFNKRLSERSDLHTVWLPIGDGIAVSVKIN
jgi:predicted O-methyltransferase YrrM